MTTLPTLAEMTDPDKMHLRLYRVWRWPNNTRVCAQHVSNPLPAWWSDVGTPDYTLVLANDEEDALAQGGTDA